MEGREVGGQPQVPICGRTIGQLSALH
jgi:hypothetical protein